MGSPAAGDCWSTYAVHMRFRPEAAVDGTYEIRFVGGEVMSLEVRDGELTACAARRASRRSSSRPSRETLHALIEGVESPESVLAGDGMRLLTGSVEDLAALARMFAPGEARGCRRGLSRANEPLPLRSARWRGSRTTR